VFLQKTLREVFAVRAMRSRKSEEEITIMQKVIVLALILFLLLIFWGCGKESPTPKSKPKTNEAALLAILAESPSDLVSRLALANLYFDSDRTWSAIPAYQEVLKQRPHDLNVRTDLGTCYKRIGDLKRARAEFELVIRDNPNHAQATFNLAIVIHMAGDPIYSAELWERAAEISTDSRISELARKNAEEARREGASETSK
jgi:Flp pilus assembly protein TadD